MVQAPKLKAAAAGLLPPAPGPKTNGVAAVAVLHVAAGLPSWGNSRAWEVLDSAELPKAELLTGLPACPNTKAATGALEAVVEPPNMPPAAEVAGALELEELLFKKLNTGFAAPWSVRQKWRCKQKSFRTRNHRKHFLLPYSLQIHWKTETFKFFIKIHSSSVQVILSFDVSKYIHLSFDGRLNFVWRKASSQQSD